MKRVSLLIIILLTLCTVAAYSEDNTQLAAIGESVTVVETCNLRVSEVIWADDVTQDTIKLTVVMDVTNLASTALDFKNLAAGQINVRFAEKAYMRCVMYEGYRRLDATPIVESDYLIPELVTAQCLWTAELPNTVYKENLPMELLMYYGESEYRFALCKQSIPLIESPLSIGELVSFGRVNQGARINEPIQWEIRAIDEERVLLISARIIDWRPFNDSFGPIRWSDSSLRRFLNEEFFNTAFMDEEREAILPSGLLNPNNTTTGISGGTATEDRLFLLSWEECVSMYPYKEGRVCAMTDLSVSRGIERASNADGGIWWLRTPGGSAGSAVVVLSDGTISAYGSVVNAESVGVRPACYVLRSYVEELIV